MAVLSKFKLAQFMVLEGIKRNTNWKGALLTGWVGVGTVMLVRGIRRDRQSSTAATTDMLLQQVKEEAEKKAGDAKTTFTFFQRLKVIMKIICPGIRTKETWFLSFLSILLIGMYICLFVCRFSVHLQSLVYTLLILIHLIL